MKNTGIEKDFIDNFELKVINSCLFLVNIQSFLDNTISRIGKGMGLIYKSSNEISSDLFEITKKFIEIKEITSTKEIEVLSF